MDTDNPLIGDATDDRTDLEMIAEYQPENRPKTIPNSAVWRGGIDGGVYIVLPTRVEGEDSVYYAEIYGEGGGSLFYKGRLRYIYPDGETNDPIDPTRTDINMWFDGERLYLGRSAQYLEPLEDLNKN